MSAKGSIVLISGSCHLTSEAAQRAAVVAEARAWRGAAYHHMARVRPSTQASTADASRDANLTPRHAPRQPQRRVDRSVDPAAGERGAVDCAQLLACVYHAAGLIPEVALEYYPPDWHLHRGLERYLNKVVEYAREIPAADRTHASDPRPGDLVLWRWGRCFAHGAIVVAWPRVVHAMAGIGVIEEDIERNGAFRDRPKRFFTLW